jgi:FkbM family methyltransferase
LKYSEFVHGWNFTIIEKAVSDKEGEAVLTIPDKSFGGASLNGNPGAPFSGTSNVNVSTITIDKLVQELQLQKVDVVKIDVEGLEPMVFEGMKETIANNPQLQVIIEYSPFLYSAPQKFSDYLFETFIVNRIKDVETTVTLDKEAMDKLVNLKDHTDLHLIRK